MNGDSQIELFLSVLVLVLSTALATGYVRLPGEIIASPILKIFLVVLALVSFSMLPMVGLSLFLLLAVIIFSRNVETTMYAAKNYQPVLRSASGPNLVVKDGAGNSQLPPLANNYSPTVETYPLTRNPEILNTNNTVYGERSITGQNIPIPSPFRSFRSDHRSFMDFNETDSRNPVLGKIMEGFQPANYGDEQGEPVEGQYPKEIARSSANPDTREYNFRPSFDTGSNDYERVDGPDLDQKLDSIKY